MKEMIPTYDEDLNLPANATRYLGVSRRANERLALF